MDAEAASPTVTAADLSAALDVPVQATAGAQGALALRFRQGVGFGAALFRQGYLDLGARYFRSTLWAGPHRCLDHLELTDLQTVDCDPAGGRLVLRGRTVLVALTRQGTLSLVPLAEKRPDRRRRRNGSRQGPAGRPAAGRVSMPTGHRV
ncbi:MAG TPA: hypothetical protein VFE37_12515 [Chloroflexota bacterium]|nr:hypothetical protein [Chloroflexota bacterium]